MTHHQLCIQRCFDLASLAAGRVTPNPRVGAVITYKNKIIGEGYHQYPGGPHAEINAINSLTNKDLLTKSSIYISLEPCNNFGKTPPCVESILKYKIPKVFISMIDANPSTMGKSIKKLEAAGVTVTVSILKSKGKKITQGFFSSIEKGRPFIVLKYAQSANKKIGAVGEQIWISNPLTKRLTHKWRSEINAILVGSNTLKTDNPRLNNRLYFGKSPVKLLLKRDGKVNLNAASFKTEGKTIVICEPHAAKLKLPNTQQWFLPFDKDLLKNILTHLKKEGLNSLLVEGGATLLNSFVQQNLWDEARIFTSSENIIHPKSIDAPEIGGTLKQTYQIGDNVLSVIENEKN